MEEEKRKTTKERIQDIKAQITANAKDVHWMKSQIDELLRLQKQEESMNKLLDVPMSEVQDSVDFDSYTVTKTVRGYLFQCKQGFSTFVGLDMANVCSLLQTIMDYKRKEDADEYEKYIIDCVAYVMQTPLFAAMGLALPAYGYPQDLEPLLNIGLSILKEFNRFGDKYFLNGEIKPETEEDVKDNITTEAGATMIEEIAASVPK